MRDDESKYTKKELEAEKELEEYFQEHGIVDEEAERLAWDATDNGPGGGRKSSSRTGDR